MMEGEDFEPDESKKPDIDPILLCKCLIDDASSEPVIIPPRKQKILSTVARTENYLRERRIPELLRFMLTKVIAEGSDKPIAYLEKLLDDCMLYRAGHGSAPVLYETKHLEAVIKSFDPGQRGWLSAGQIRRLYTTLGLTPEDDLDDRISTEVVFNNVKKAQESELLCLLSAGMPTEDLSENTSSTSTKMDFLAKKP
ncbi:hypothetical protein MSG28_011028 [Choristoneura fumiferana]|uniref:Uncharacterized protein n=1 Tax=Choristoneura fumiferana TaxID=7141 RepID=A0ACC0KR99_CHOFU|nr:hypothetical protein MSG28_011028 [Choristoneura fumiferana]